MVKTKNVIKTLIISLVLIASLLIGAMLLIPNTPNTVSAAEPGSSATLAFGPFFGEDGSSNYGEMWTEKLVEPVTMHNILNLVITNKKSIEIGGNTYDDFTTVFTKGEDVQHTYSDNSIYYYYQKTDIKVNVKAFDNLINGTDEVEEDYGYNVVIYADVDKIYAPHGNTVDWYPIFSLPNCRSIVLDNFDTSNVTDMSLMFFGCTSLTSLDLSNFDTSNVTYMDGMFSVCSSLSSLDLSGWDTSNVTIMSHIFNGCTSLTTINASGIVLTNTTASMFSGISSLQTLNLSNADTSNVTYMDSMFYNCTSLTSLDLSNFNTSKVTIMGSMFSGCSSLTSLDLTNFDTSNVTDMGGMFLGSSSLTSLDVSSFDTSNVTSMYGMFLDCTSLTSLDLSNFKTSNVTDMECMFAACNSLSQLDISSFSFASISDASGVEMMFGMSHAMVAQMLVTQGEPIDVEEYVNATYEGKIQILVTLVDSEELAQLLVDMGETRIPKIIAPNDIGSVTVDLVCDYYYFENEQKVYVSALSDATNGKTLYSIPKLQNGFIENCSELYSKTKNLIITDTLTNEETAVIKTAQKVLIGSNLYAYFIPNGSLYDCIIEAYAITGNTNGMFAGSEYLESITIKGVNLSRADLTSMFAGCNALKTIDINGIDLSHITTATQIDMFEKTYNLEADDVVLLYTTYNMVNGTIENTFGLTEPLNKEQVAQLYVQYNLVGSIEEFYSACDQGAIIEYYQAMAMNYGIPNNLITEEELQYLASLTDQEEITELCRQITLERFLPDMIEDEHYGPIMDAYLLAAPQNIVTIVLPEQIGSASLTLPQAMIPQGENEAITVATNVHNGKVLTLQGVEPILPPDVGEIDPDTPESGVTLVDLLILTMLTLVLSGVCVIILKNKNKSLIKK